MFTILKEMLLMLEDKVDFVANQLDKKLLAAKEKDSSNKEDTSLEMVQFIVSKIDPSKQYLTWISRMYGDQLFKFEDAARLKKDLELFTKVKNKLTNKDLNSYKNLNQMYDALHPFENASADDLATNKQKVAAVKKDSEVFLDEPDFKVIIPKTEESACLYGAGTKWCTAADNDNMFKHYHDQGPLMIIITKIDGKQRKFQMHYESDSFMDERDSEVGKADIAELSKIPAYTKFINKLIAKHYVKHFPK